MQLINNRPIPWDGGPASPTGANRAIVGPSERGIDYDALRHQRRTIPLIESEIVFLSAECVTQQLGTPLELTDMLLRIGIQYQLVGIEPMAFVGFIGAVYAIGIYRAWRRVGQISVPDLISVFGQLNSLDFLRSVLIEQTQFDFGGVG